MEKLEAKLDALALPFGGLLFLAAGIAGWWGGVLALKPHAHWFLPAGILMLLLAGARLTYRAQPAEWPDADTATPSRLTLGLLDYLKALVCWADAFKQTYAVAPGLYYTGEKLDTSAPLLVTANYHLSVFFLLRALRGIDARVLVVDSSGINVWCSSSEGQFTNDSILQQVRRYDPELLADGKRKRPTLILPKLCFAGVDLKELRKEGLRPIIGPVKARDVPAYLAAPPYRDCKEVRFDFNLTARLFTWLPGLIQYLGYGCALFAILFVAGLLFGFEVPAALLLVIAAVGTAYPLLFPVLPGERFAVKGLWLAGLGALGMVAMVALGRATLAHLPMGITFVVATGLFVGLTYTGNSAVSNYSRVRQEIARFLPLELVFFLASLVLLVTTGGHR